VNITWPSFVVVGQLAFLGGDALKQVVDKAVDDGLAGDSGSGCTCKGVKISYVEEMQ